MPDKQVVYKTVDETDLKLHIFNPEGHKSTDKQSAIVFFFGGVSSSTTKAAPFRTSSRFARIVRFVCCLDHALIEHGIRYLNKAGDVGAHYQVARVTVFFGSVIGGCVDGLHDTAQTFIDLFSGPTHA